MNVETISVCAKGKIPPLSCPSMIMRRWWCGLPATTPRMSYWTSIGQTSSVPNPAKTIPQSDTTDRMLSNVRETRSLKRTRWPSLNGACSRTWFVTLSMTSECAVDTDCTSVASAELSSSSPSTAWRCCSSKAVSSSLRALSEISPSASIWALTRRSRSCLTLNKKRKEPRRTNWSWRFLGNKTALVPRNSRKESAYSRKDSDRYKVFNLVGVTVCNSIPRETHRGPARVRPSVPWSP